MDTVTTLATVPAILALVNLAKQLGVSGKWSAVLAVVLGGGLNAAAVLLAGNVAYDAISSGVLLGLGAAGLYDMTRTATPTTMTAGVKLESGTVTIIPKADGPVEAPAAGEGSADGNQ